VPLARRLFSFFDRSIENKVYARDRRLIVNEAEAALVRRIFEGLAQTESGTKLVQALRAEGATTKRGRPFTKSDIYRVLSNRTCICSPGAVSMRTTG
jgi:hypothetical protein